MSKVPLHRRGAHCSSDIPILVRPRSHPSGVIPTSFLEPFEVCTWNEVLGAHCSSEISILVRPRSRRADVCAWDEVGL